MTLEKIIASVQEVYSRGTPSKDSRLTDRHIYQSLIVARAVVLRQQANQSQYLNEQAFQILPCVQLQEATYHECPCAPPTDCKILRTKHKIPSVVSDLSGHLIDFTTINGNQPFDTTTFEGVRYAKGNKYTSNKPLVFPRNGYYYFTVEKDLEVIAARGIFNDPVEAHLFPSFCECEECECADIMQMEFPIDNNGAKGVIQLASQELVMILKQIKEDRLNDAVDDDTVIGLIHQPRQQ